MPPAAKKAAPAKAKPDADDTAPPFCPTPAECFPHGIQHGHHHAACVHGEWDIPTE